MFVMTPAKVSWTGVCGWDRSNTGVLQGRHAAQHKLYWAEGERDFNICARAKERCVSLTDASDQQHHFVDDELPYAILLAALHLIQTRSTGSGYRV
jgi:hypothetical protein